MKYTKTSTDVLQKVFCPKVSFVSHGCKEWLCKTCDRTLSRSSMLLQAKGNDLHLCEVPPELSGMNTLELRLTSQRVPFMKMVAFASGKQCSIHRPAVYVPSKVDTESNLVYREKKMYMKKPFCVARIVVRHWYICFNYIVPMR